jgi:hypothetical protein
LGFLGDLKDFGVFRVLMGLGEVWVCGLENFRKIEECCHELINGYCLFLGILILV